MNTNAGNAAKAKPPTISDVRYRGSYGIIEMKGNFRDAFEDARGRDTELLSYAKRLIDAVHREGGFVAFRVDDAVFDQDSIGPFIYELTAYQDSPRALISCDCQLPGIMKRMNIAQFYRMVSTEEDLDKA